MISELRLHLQMNNCFWNFRHWFTRILTYVIWEYHSNFSANYMQLSVEKVPVAQLFKEFTTFCGTLGKDYMLCNIPPYEFSRTSSKLIPLTSLYLIRINDMGTSVTTRYLFGLWGLSDAVTWMSLLTSLSNKYSSFYWHYTSVWFRNTQILVWVTFPVSVPSFQLK
jgi:hypothetical protein